MKRRSRKTEDLALDRDDDPEGSASWQTRAMKCAASSTWAIRMKNPPNAPPGSKRQLIAGAA
jgi:hypothetical protein